MHFTNLEVALLRIYLLESRLGNLNHFLVLLIGLIFLLLERLDGFTDFQEAPQRSRHIVVNRLFILYVINNHKSVCKILPAQLQKIIWVLCRQSLGIEDLGVFKVYLVVDRVYTEKFLEAELGLQEVLFAQVNVAEFLPSFLVDLVNLKILIQQSDGLAQHIIVPVKRHEPFDGQTVLGRLLEDFQIYLLGSHCVIKRLVKHA